MNNKKINKGRGWHGDPTGHSLAGKMGGVKTFEQYGSEFFHDIGSRGGKVSRGNFKNDPERARLAGKKGGSSKKR